MSKIFFYIIGVLVLLCTDARAQDEEVLLSINDSIVFGECHGSNYTYIDFYKKTRFESDSIDFNKLEEWAFYNTFFETGDFDVSRLPCSLANSTAVIKHIMQIQTPEGKPQTIVIAMIEYGKSVAYIIADAFMHEEVFLVPIK